MSDKRHYDTDNLHKDYKQVYGLMMKVTMWGVGGALVYFFIFIVYLGGWSHTRSTDYAATFNDRYPQDYKGLKLPEFGGPTAPEPKHHGDEAHADAGHGPAHGEAAAQAAAGPATVAVSSTEMPDSMGAAGSAIETGTAVEAPAHTDEHTQDGAH